MFNKKFNSKYAAEIPHITRDNQEELSGAGIQEVPQTWDDDNFNDGSERRPEVSQLRTRVMEPPFRHPLINTRTPGLEPDERIEDIQVDPMGLTRDHIISEIGRQHATGPQGEVEDIRIRKRAAASMLRAVSFMMDKTLRDAAPCPVCKGAKNGGNDVNNNDQEYCPGCNNKGYVLPNIKCSTCKGSGKDDSNKNCSSCHGHGELRQNILSYLYNIHKDAANKNASSEFHRNHCTELACDSKCPINRVKTTCTECGGEGTADGLTCRSCKGEKQVGLVDALRNKFNSEEQEKYDSSVRFRRKALETGEAVVRSQGRDANDEDARGKVTGITIENIDEKLGPEYKKQPLTKKVTHPVSGSERETVATAGKSAIVDGYKEPARQIPLNKAIDAPYEIGDFVMLPNPGAYTNTNDYPNATDPNRKLLDRAMKDRTSGSTYVDPLTHGIVSGLAKDGTLEIVPFGRSSSSMRNEYEDRMRNPIYHTMRRMVRTAKTAFGVSRGPNDMPEDQYRSDDINQRTKRHSIIDHLSNIKSSFIAPEEEVSPVQKWTAGRVISVHPSEVARLTELTAPELFTAGTTVGGYTVGYSGINADSKTNVIHRLSPQWSQDALKFHASTALNQHTRRTLSRVLKDLDSKASIEPGSPDSLSSPLLGAQMVSAPKEKKKQKNKRVTDQKNIESPLAPFVPVMPTVQELPGKVPYHQTDDGKENLLGTAAKHLKRPLTRDEREDFLGAIDEHKGSIEHGLKAIGVDRPEEDETNE